MTLRTQPAPNTPEDLILKGGKKDILQFQEIYFANKCIRVLYFNVKKSVNIISKCPSL